VEEIGVGQEHGVDLGEVGLDLLDRRGVEFVVPAAVE
jgi:hypothetical protein